MVYTLAVHIKALIGTETYINMDKYIWKFMRSVFLFFDNII